jgi:poly-gamma-glutamate capsule biosynthesis protein CapA/YwtB (metallophosphatase superfamily)
MARETKMAGETIRVFLCGDVMLGRGVDQVLPCPSDPTLYEDYAQSALDYVRLAEMSCGPISRPRAPAAIFGAASAELDRAAPDARIINLETTITRSDTYVPKGINYRMSPENSACLEAAKIDCCVLANNHMLDFGRAGLRETLTTLQGLHIATAGAGRDLVEARAPAVLEVAGKGRVIVLAFACETSGTPRGWAAGDHQAGVSLLEGSTEEQIARIAETIERLRRPGDIFVVSIHWGPNWGYEITDAERRLAHGLVERAGVSVVHGHSSHHAKAIEIANDRLVLYGCGDFLNDYEGIGGREEFRSDLALVYLADIVPSDGSVAGLEIIPFRIRGLTLGPVSAADRDWIEHRLGRESARFRTHRRPSIASSRFATRMQAPKCKEKLCDDHESPCRAQVTGEAPLL